MQDDYMTAPKKRSNEANGPSLGSKKPEEYLKSLLAERGIWYKTHAASSLEEQGSFFVEMKHQNFADYTNEIAFAVRRGDLNVLKDHVRSGKTPQCCNRYKESIVHTICRRGHHELLEYILDETDASSLRLCCDQERTPLHDAAWSHKPNFDLIKLIIQKCPDLLYIEDKRGNTPLGYVGHQSWDDWCAFLKQNQDYLLPTRLV
jgi:ankyrin repeat protein